MTNLLTGEMVVDYLTAKGHKRIAINTDLLNEESALLRLKGYEKGRTKNNVSTNKAYIKSGDFNRESGYDLAKQLALTDISAVFVTSSKMFLGAFTALKEIGSNIEILCLYVRNTEKINTEVCFYNSAVIWSWRNFCPNFT